MKTGWLKFILLLSLQVIEARSESDPKKDAPVFGDVPGPSRSTVTLPPRVTPEDKSKPVELAPKVKTPVPDKAKTPADDKPVFGVVPGPSRTSAVLPPPPIVVEEQEKAEPAKPSKPVKPLAPVVKTNLPPVVKTRTEPTAPPIVTPDTSQTGKVVKFNEAARIVVLEFPLTKMPGPERQLFVYRNDLKVGEVKTTKWQNREHVVADLLNGEVKEGDVVRDR